MPTERIRLDFGNLPLIEAAVRASFETPGSLTFRTINAVAASLQGEFPQLAEPTQLEAAPGVTAKVEFGPGQITGALYTGNRDGLTITVQSHVVVARWLPRVGVAEAEYPRFPALRDALWRAVDAFKAACGQDAPRVHVVNMSYVNFLRIPHSSPVLRRYFSKRIQIEAAADAQQVHKLEASWREADESDFRFSLEQVTARVADESVQGYRLTTAAGRRVQPSDKEQEILERAHERLQSLFHEWLSADARKEWQLQEVSCG